jgi:hypothetical protein
VAVKIYLQIVCKISLSTSFPQPGRARGRAGPFL